MTTQPPYPALYQINTRLTLAGLTAELGRPATLIDIPDATLDQLADQGFDYIWLLGVWQTGPTSRAVSRTHPDLRREFEQALPDLTDADITGSPFAVTAYTVHTDFGGDRAFAQLRERMHARGLKLILDFVPNHTGLDHPWVQEHPDFYVAGDDADLNRAPQNFIRISGPDGDQIFAHGRDPYFPGWSDTLQLNYGNPELQAAMASELAQIASRCDGVRCDMAMLLLPEVFQQAWGVASEPFWPAAIERVRAQQEDFLFLAEVYWDLEWTLQQQGFNFCYDKRLYDRLIEQAAQPVREHFLAGLDYQNGLARFLENHDEPRAAATFDWPQHRAAALLTYLSPGLRFFHQGQLQGYRTRIPVHLGRGLAEGADRAVEDFYARLLDALGDDVLRSGRWQLLDCQPAWEGNETWANSIAFLWSGPDRQHRLVVVNYASYRGQCRIPLRIAGLPGESWRLVDLLGHVRHELGGDELSSEGLFVDMPAWGYHLFDLQMV